MCGIRGFARPSLRVQAGAGYSPLVLALLLLLPTLGATAELAEIRDGLAVVTSDGERHATLAPGIPMTLWVRGDRLYGPSSSPSHDGLRAIQFSVDIDPRLSVLERAFVDPNTLDFEVAPEEWILGMDCLSLQDGTPSIMAYTVMIMPGETDIENIRVSPRDLESYGEPLGWTTCAGGNYQRDMFNAGGVLLNPSPGSIVHLSAGPPVAVEGRSYRVAWETVASDEVYLNGQPVAAAGGIDAVATETQDYVLTTVVDGVENTEQLTVDVLQKPRILSYTAERNLSHDSYLVTLRWQIEGVNVISIDGAPGNYPAIGSATFPDKTPSEWILRASNEWGMTAAIASPDPLAEGPPLILQFTNSTPDWSPAEPVRLSWNLVGATSARIEPGIGVIDPASTGMEVSISESSVLELVATNEFGESRAQLELELQPVSIQSFKLENYPFGGLPLTVSWQTESAEVLSIDPLVGTVVGSAGSTTLTTPAGHTTLTLSASNATSSEQRALTFTPSAPVIRLRAPTSAVEAGVPFQFQIYQLNGALSASVDQGIGDITPEAQYIDAMITQDTVFTVSATNSSGTSTESIEIVVGSYGTEAPLVGLSVDDSTPPLGVPVQLNYVIQNAQTATLSPGIGEITPAVSGSVEINPLVETTYALSATNPNGVSTVELTVSPGAPEIVSFTADDNPLPYGQASTTLHWEFEGATSSAIAALGMTDLPAVGSVEVSPTADTEYELVVTNPYGESRKTLTLTLAPPPAQIASFGATPNVVRSGDRSYLIWEVTGAFNTVEILGFGSQPAQGQLAVEPTATTDYTLRVTMAVGTLEATTTVTVDDTLQPDLVLAWSASDPNAEAPVVMPYEPFKIWALGVDMSNGITGADFRLGVPDCVTLIGQSLPSGGLNLTPAPDAVIGFGQCLDAPVVPLVEYTLVVEHTEGCPAQTEFLLQPSSVGSEIAERANCGNLVLPFRVGPPLSLYAGSAGEPVSLELTLDGQSSAEGVELSWDLPGSILPTTLCLHRLSSAGDERLDEWGDGNKDIAKAGRYMDTEAPEGEPIQYWLEASYEGDMLYSEHVEMELAVSYIPPRQPVFRGASPNPFNPRTEILFELDRARQVQLTIYDISGRRIWSQAGRFEAGPHAVPWTGVDHGGRSVASGSYFVQLSYEGGSLSSRMTLVR